MSDNTIRHFATIFKVQTLTDHGIRISLDLPESAIMQAAMYMECQRMQVVLDIEAKPRVQNTTENDAADGKKSRQDRKSLRGN